MGNLQTVEAFQLIAPLLPYLVSILEQEIYEVAPTKSKKRNCKDYDRGHALRKVDRLSDETFSKMFRMNREGFAKLLDLISPFLPGMAFDGMAFVWIEKDN